ncbi:hypothetical protein GGR57DRAFT_455252 [Xylariaceae sp. FL1272]|nr:hypothetical protein GGR57DRAFT_455252 [Xylariaceae sp. FL1272]
MDDSSDTDATPRRRASRALPVRQAKIKAPARETRSTAAYFAGSPDSSQPSSPASDTTPPVRYLRPLPKKRKLQSSYTSPASVKQSKRRHITAEEDDDDDGTPVASPDIVIPPWQTLPYHVWLRVFDCIAAPIRDTAARIDHVAESVTTLLAGARACRAILEPALAALYKCPPFYHLYSNKAPQNSFTSFLHTLALDPAGTIIQYRPKVKTLRIDVDACLTKKVDDTPRTLERVVRDLPQLRSLELYSSFDNPPYRDLLTHLRWKVTEDDMSAALQSVVPDGDSSAQGRAKPVALQSWRWNSRLFDSNLALGRIAEVHKMPSFQTLRKVSYVNYQLPSLTRFAARARESQEAQESDRQAIAQLAASISVLPDLLHLVIESSTFANGSLLESLPKTLKHLELVNCWEISSEDLTQFLTSHGSSLTHLTLKHCQSLSLGFLTVLGVACPNLTHLEIDLSYFRHHASYADNKPEYEVLLDADEVPTWPTSIQSIQIINMRNWNREAAEMFFDSLTNNAQNLACLRRLEFKVILDIEWRQRQEMRKSLADQMSKIFKRNSAPPKDHKTLQTKAQIPSTPVRSEGKSGTRRSTRIAGESPIPVSPDVHTLPSLESARKRSRLSLREVRSLNAVLPIFDADDEESSEDELAMKDGPNTRKAATRITKNPSTHIEPFIQGLCDVVDIQVDNQRPAERQYDMEDFLDSPEQEESDWESNGDDVFD